MVRRQVAPDYFIAHLVFNPMTACWVPGMVSPAGHRRTVAPLLGSCNTMPLDYSHVITLLSINTAHSCVLRNSSDTVSLKHAFMSTETPRYFSHVPPAVFFAILSSRRVYSIWGS